MCFWDAAHHNNDDKIKVLNALIWDSQHLSFHPCTLSFAQEKNLTQNYEWHTYSWLSMTAWDASGWRFVPDFHSAKRNEATVFWQQKDWRHDGSEHWPDPDSSTPSNTAVVTRRMSKMTPPATISFSLSDDFPLVSCLSINPPSK